MLWVNATHTSGKLTHDRLLDGIADRAATLVPRQMQPGLDPGRTADLQRLTAHPHVTGRQCGPGQARCHVQPLAASKAGKQAKTARAEQ